VEVPTVFRPHDWRDHWIIDPCRSLQQANTTRKPLDGATSTFQGGTPAASERLVSARPGRGAIWLSPVLKNCQYNPTTYHGYGIQDFLAVDPRLAADPVAAARRPELAENELRALIDEAHARGIYVIFDIVLNHAGDVFEYADAGVTGPSPYAIHCVMKPVRPLGLNTARYPPREAIWPAELRQNNSFDGRQCTAPADQHDYRRRFFTLKQFARIISRRRAIATRCATR
jgi:hypothetical protein